MALVAFCVSRVSFAEVPSDDKLHIYFCGTGNPSPEKQWLRHPSCLAVAYDRQFFLIDAGAGASVRLSALGLPPQQLSRVFLTHLHSDHFAGLGALVNSAWIFGRQTKLPVYGPYGLIQVIDGIKASYRPDVWFRSINRAGRLDPNIADASAHVIDLSGKKKAQVWQDKHLRVTAYPVHHEPVSPAFGYMLNYKHCSVFVTGDTRVFKQEADIVKDVDVMISEAMSHPLQAKKLTEAKKAGRAAYAFTKQIIHYHSDTLALAKLAQKAQVKHLYLTHLDPSIDTSKTEKAAFTAGMSEYYTGPIVVADDLDEMILSTGKNNTCQVEYHPTQK